MNACILQWKYKPLEFSAETTQSTTHKPKLWHFGSERSQDLHTCHQKHSTGHILDCTNKSLNMSRNIYDHIYL